MTRTRCEHDWTDRSANRSAEWVCTKCKQSFTELEPSTAIKRPWVGLTDKEIEECWDGDLSPYKMQCIREIEAKLKEKNA
jgi:hypothetical protein